MGFLPHLENLHHPPRRPNRLRMLRRRTDRHRLVFGVREKVQAPADGADKPDQHPHNGEHDMGHKCGEEQRQAEGGDNRPSGGRRELDEVMRFGMIVLHGQ